MLLAAESLRNEEIAARLKMTLQKVGRWGARFPKHGLGGIEKDAPRSGRIPSISARKRVRIVKKTIEEKPPNATHWSRTSMAKATGVSDSTVGRIWRAHGLKPHLSGTFKLSNDKQFAEKLEDVVGLYLNPPENAIVLSCDEKSQMQALDRKTFPVAISSSRGGRCRRLPAMGFGIPRREVRPRGRAHANPLHAWPTHQPKPRSLHSLVSPRQSPPPRSFV